MVTNCHHLPTFLSMCHRLADAKWKNYSSLRKKAGINVRGRVNERIA